MVHLYNQTLLQAVNASGAPLSGAKLFFYQTGTTTDITTYQDAAKTTPHTNPVLADATGYFPPVYVDTDTYKVVLKDSLDVTIQTIDPVYSSGVAADPASSRATLSVTPSVATRTALKALDTTKDIIANLSEAGRRGRWYWLAGNYSTQIAADTDEAFYLKADAVAATAGAWVRFVDGREVYPSWAGIDETGATDVSSALTRMVANKPAGTRIVFAKDATYKLDSTVNATTTELVDLGATFTGQGILQAKNVSRPNETKTAMRNFEAWVKDETGTNATSLSKLASPNLDKFRPKCADIELLRLSPSVTRFERSSDGAADYMTSDYIREVVREMAAAGVSHIRLPYLEYLAFKFARVDMDWVNLDGGIAPAAGLTLSATSGASVTVTASAAVFSSSDVGKYIFESTGRGKIVTYTSSTQVTIDTTVSGIGATFSTTSLTSTNWKITYPTTWWKNFLSPYPNIEDFDPFFVILDEAEKNGMRVFAGLSRFGDVNLMNDLYSINILGNPDPIRHFQNINTRYYNNAALTRKFAAQLYAKYGHFNSFYGFYISHEPDHIASTIVYLDIVNLTTGVISEPVLRSYNKPVMIASSSPIDLAATTTFADTLISTGCDIHAPQDSVGPGLDFTASPQRQTYIPAVAIADLEAHFSAWAEAVRIANSYSKLTDRRIALWSTTETWEMGRRPAGTLTLSATSGSSITATLSSNVLTADDVGRWITTATGGNAKIVSQAGNSAVIDTTVAGGYAFASVGPHSTGNWAVSGNGATGVQYTHDFPTDFARLSSQIKEVQPYVEGICLYAWFGFMDSGNASLRPMQANSGQSNFRSLAQSLYTGYKNYADGQRKKFSEIDEKRIIQRKVFSLAADTVSSSGVTNINLGTFRPVHDGSTCDFNVLINAKTDAGVTNFTRAFELGGTPIRSLVETAVNPCGPSAVIKYSDVRLRGASQSVVIKGTTSAVQHTIFAGSQVEVTEYI